VRNESVHVRCQIHAAYIVLNGPKMQMSNSQFLYGFFFPAFAYKHDQCLVIHYKSTQTQHTELVD